LSCRSFLRTRAVPKNATAPPSRSHRHCILSNKESIVEEEEAAEEAEEEEAEEEE